MNFLDDQSLLQVWEFGIKHSVIETNLLLLSYVYPEYDINQVTAFSIGERDARLLSIREQLFGPLFYNTSICPACGQKMEWETTVDSLKLQPIQKKVDLLPIELKYKQYQLSLRLPNSQDILEVTRHTQHNTEADNLIRKCILNSTLPAEQIEDLSDELRNVIITKMEENDPQANIVMNLSCLDCEQPWSATFDIMQYLWTEINDWAVQLIQDIYLLARTFGWSENDILTMSRFRRNLYINMISQ